MLHKKRSFLYLIWHQERLESCSMLLMFPEELLKKWTPPNCWDNFVMPARCSGTTFRLSLFSWCGSTLLEACEHIYSLCYAAYSPRPDSGESKRPVDKDPSSWGVEEVVWFIKDADPQALGPHADAFRKHVGSPYLLSLSWSTIVEPKLMELSSTQHAVGHQAGKSLEKPRARI